MSKPLSVRQVRITPTFEVQFLIRAQPAIRRKENETMLTYEDCTALFHRNFPRRKLRRNVYLHRIQQGEVTYFQVSYHDRLIGIIFPDSHSLFDGRYQSASTKANLNRFLVPYGCAVIQRNYEWFYSTSQGATIPFKSGMRVILQTGELIK